MKAPDHSPGFHSWINMTPSSITARQAGSVVGRSNRMKKTAFISMGKRKRGRIEVCSNFPFPSLWIEDNVKVKGELQPLHHRAF